MLRSQFEVMKERSHVRWNLEWISSNESSTPRSDAVNPKSPILNKRLGIKNNGSLTNKLARAFESETPPRKRQSDDANQNM
jgi:hypothetical protein